MHVRLMTPIRGEVASSQATCLAIYKLNNEEVITSSQSLSPLHLYIHTDIQNSHVEITHTAANQHHPHPQNHTQHIVEV